ncbi:MAG: prepilin-type N-terminal cleavage/methylation domain-containing protein [Desulfonauticus sp.]|nr:prepilin-type N-terminal cleavage/methylation domain-containing protein [Desulfonauticus sp.]
MARKNGFTLIELLIIIAIIGILSVIAIPKYTKYKERAARSVAISDARNLATNIELYAKEHDTYPSSPDDLSFKLSKDNEVGNYTANSTGYSYRIINTSYNKYIAYDSKIGLDTSTWPLH